MSIYLIYDLEPDHVAGLLADLGFSFGERRSTHRVVLDTFDGRLHERGMRLELRDGTTRELVLLTTDTDSPPAQLEWIDTPPRFANDLPAGPFGRRIASVVDERILLPVMELQTACRVATNRDRRGNPVTRVALHDDVRVTLPDESAVAGCIVEVTTSTGHGTAKRVVADIAIEARARDRGGLVDAVLAATGRSLEVHVRSPMVPLQRDDDALAAFRAVFRNLLGAYDDNLPGTIAGLDTEFLHDLRVALRRTRSVLTEAKHVVPAEIRDRHRAGFAKLAAATSRSRDLDVYLLEWPIGVAALRLDDPSVMDPLHDMLESRRTEAHAAMQKEFDSDATRELIDSWRAWLDDPSVDEVTVGPVGPYVAARIAKAQRGLLRDGRAITPESPAERLHDLRKDAKKLRYLFECFGDLLPPKGRKSFVAQLKALQDNLGMHQDAEVQVNELRALANELHDGTSLGTDAVLAVGQLIDQLESVRRRERDAFAPRFEAYDTSENRKLLRALLAKAAKV